MNPYENYARKASTIAKRHPAPLIGVTKTRREAMVVYSQIVAELAACGDQDQLDCYLASAQAQLVQFQAELPFLWKGDGEDFLGIEREIEATRDRVSIGADADFLSDHKFGSDPDCEARRLPGHFEPEMEI